MFGLSMVPTMVAALCLPEEESLMIRLFCMLLRSGWAEMQAQAVLASIPA